MIEFFQALLTDFGSKIVNLLPSSPFHSYIVEFARISKDSLGFLNWFIPIGKFVEIGLAWLTCIALFYGYSIVMRWVKMIGD